MDTIKVKGIDKPFSKLVMGTAWFNPAFKDEIFAMLDAYKDAGGTVIDCGRFYGAATSEPILKEYFDTRGNREDFIVIDKCCHPIITPDGGHHPDYWRVNPELITDDLHYSLYHMGVSYFDLYLLHRDDESVSIASIMDRLEKHRREGLITAYGVSNWELDRVIEAYEYCKKMDYEGFAVNNPSYSLAKVRETRWSGCVYADDDYAAWHKDTDVTLLSWASQAHGFFADIYARDGSAPQDIQKAFFYEDNFERLERCKVLSKTYHVDPINIALAYVLSQPFNVAAVIGSRNRNEFESCVQTLGIKLSQAELDYLSLKSDINPNS